ncbi:MAG: type II toxin-antitoxin system VapC family toxin [Cuniculiplasma sp.]|jgi:predicted nucleic acid-binding protein
MTTTRRKKPKPYLDTNIILDYIRNRKKDSVLLLETLKRRKLRTWTAFYTILEVIDKELESKWIWRRAQSGETLEDIIRTRYPRKLTKEELRSVYDEVVKKFWKDFIETDIIYLSVPYDEDWDDILQIMIESNISIGDAIQIDAAIKSGSNVFITRDGDLLKTMKEKSQKMKLNIIAASPQDLEKKLKAGNILPILPMAKGGKDDRKPV